ncbi:MAG: hypothetical protein GKR77_07500 [Legionellales bacterium]|nr:hypothetical protein [Legionellales bacterium]
MTHSQACFCGSGVAYVACCQPLLTGKQWPTTAEALMRSRYTAYRLVDIHYIQKTMAGPALNGFSKNQAKRWAQRVKWQGLTLVATTLNEAGTQATVEFIARFDDQGTLKQIHERSIFIKQNQRWVYWDGETPQPSAE